MNDEADVVKNMRRFLRGDGHEVAATSDGLEALALVNDTDFDAAFIDIAMPKLDGLTLMRALLRDHRRCRIVLMSGYREMLEELDDASGPLLFLSKPFTLEGARTALGVALQQNA